MGIDVMLSGNDFHNVICRLKATTWGFKCFVVLIIEILVITIFYLQMFTCCPTGRFINRAAEYYPQNPHAVTALVAGFVVLLFLVICYIVATSLFCPD